MAAVPVTTNMIRSTKAKDILWADRRKNANASESLNDNDRAVFTFDFDDEIL